MADVQYLYATFGAGSRNFGNAVIDYATRHLLRDQLPPPAAEFDAFRRAQPTGSYDFVLVPGGTMITAGQNPGLDQIGALGCPVYCLAGSIWTNLPKPGWLLRSRLIRPPEAPAVDMRIVHQLTPPIGCRDRFTYERVSADGIEAYYTGCPTLMLPLDGIGNDGYVLFSLGRRYFRRQTRAAHRLARRHHVIGLVHEVDDYERVRAAGWTLPLVTYSGELELYLSYLKRAAVVVTGRLHAALPALAYGKPVFYYGTRDTRTTILDDLGVPIHSYRELKDAVERASACANRQVLSFFRDNWNRVLQGIVDRHPARERRVAVIGGTA